MSKYVWDTLQQYLKDNWTTTPVLEPWNAFVQEPRSAFVCLDLEAEEAQTSFGAPGDNRYRETGFINLSIVDVSNTGMDNVNLWADQLRALFRGQLINGVQCREAGPPSPEQGSGLYFHVIVTISYYYDLLGG